MGRAVYLGQATVTGSLHVDPKGKTVTWSTQGAIDARVYVTDGQRTLFAQGPGGSQEAPWLAPGNAVIFELVPIVDQDEALVEGAPLARVTVDANMVVTETQKSPGAPAGEKAPPGGSIDWFSLSRSTLISGVPDVALGVGGLLFVALLLRRKQ